MKQAEEIVSQLTDHLDNADMGYHAHLAGRVQTEGPQLDKQIRQAQQELADLQGAQVTWGGYIQQKYGLGDGDTVMPDGTIKRKAQPE